MRDASCKSKKSGDRKMRIKLNLVMIAVVLLSCAGSIFAQQQRCVPPPPQMVAWFDFDASSGTIAGNRINGGNVGTLTNGPTWGAGKVLNALNFDGSNDFVQVADQPQLNFGDGNFSIDAWIKLDQQSGSGVKAIVDKRVGMGPGYMFFVYNGRLAVQLNTSGTGPNSGFYNYFASSTSTVVADGRWHHVAVTVNRSDQAGIVFYVDGAASGTPSNPRNRMGNLNNTSP
jgi:hypothetical protein